jgi:hypothetical protein
MGRAGLSGQSRHSGSPQEVTEEGQAGPAGLLLLQVLGALGCPRRRMLLLWQALELGRSLPALVLPLPLEAPAPAPGSPPATGAGGADALETYVPILH